MPRFNFASIAVREQVVGLSTKGIFHDGPIIDGTPWPELVFGFSAKADLGMSDLLDLGVFNPHPIIDGIPAPELIQDFGVFG